MPNAAPRTAAPAATAIVTALRVRLVIRRGAVKSAAPVSYARCDRGGSRPLCVAAAGAEALGDSGHRQRIGRTNLREVVIVRKVMAVRQRLFAVNVAQRLIADRNEVRTRLEHEGTATATIQ